MTSLLTVDTERIPEEVEWSSEESKVGEDANGAQNKGHIQGGRYFVYT